MVHRIVASGKMTRNEYVALHQWVRYKLGKPTRCNNCEVSTARYEWANISGEYHRDLCDFEPLCASCHRRKDSWGDPNVCKKGHRLTEDNLYVYPNGKFKECKTCRRLNRPPYAKESK